MNTKRLSTHIPGAFCAAICILIPGVSASVSDSQYESIKALGMLNGVALNCRYLEEIQRMKQALVDTLPKRRELGMAFDQITNEAFLAFIERNESCPEASDFAASVGEAIQSLEQSFSNKDSE